MLSLTTGEYVKHIPAISTAHITENDGALLRGLPVCDRILMEILSEGAGHMIRTGWAYNYHWSEPFRNLVKEFHALGYPWIILEADGDKIEGVPTFEW